MNLKISYLFQAFSNPTNGPYRRHFAIVTSMLKWDYENQEEGRAASFLRGVSKGKRPS